MCSCYAFVACDHICKLYYRYIIISWLDLWLSDVMHTRFDMPVKITKKISEVSRKIRVGSLKVEGVNKGEEKVHVTRLSVDYQVCRRIHGWAFYRNQKEPLHVSMNIMDMELSSCIWPQSISPPK